MFTLGDLLRQMRKARKLTQQELGRRVGVSDTMVSYWENDATAPSLPQLRLLLRALEATAEQRARVWTVVQEDDEEAGARGGGSEARPFPDAPVLPDVRPPARGARADGPGGGGLALGPADTEVPAWGVALMSAVRELSQAVADLARRAGPVVAALYIMHAPTPAEAAWIREARPVVSSSCDYIALGVSLISRWLRRRVWALVAPTTPPRLFAFSPC